MNRRSAESTLVIVQPGEKLPTLQSVPGDFADWIIDGLARADLPVRIVRPHRGDTLPAEADVAAVVVTGSSSMVTDRDPWMQASADWLRRLVEREVPVLGICFGHQLLAYALGGNVQDNPNGIEVGTVVTQLHPEAHSDPLFGGLPEALSVQASHRQAVTGLPAIRIPITPFGWVRTRGVCSSIRNSTPGSSRRTPNTTRPRSPSRAWRRPSRWRGFGRHRRSKRFWRVSVG